MDYELYHDESLEGGYWHGMLLVPTWTKKDFSDLLATARNNAGYFDKIGIKKVGCCLLKINHQRKSRACIFRIKRKEEITIRTSGFARNEIYLISRARFS